MATLLSKTQSTAGSPYVYYKLNYSTSNRTATGVTISVSGTANLQYGSSTLGSGSNYTLTGHLTSSYFSKDFTIKGSSASWSGTTEHSFSTTITLTNLTGSQTSISGIKFSVTRGNNSTSAAGYLKSTSCNNITFPTGHENPTINSITITETNPKLLLAGVGGNYFVLGLSQKQFTINASYEDDAQYDHTTLYNYYTTNIGAQKTNTINAVSATNNNILDTSVVELKPFIEGPSTNLLRLAYEVYDNKGGSTEYNYNTYYPFDYLYQTYSKPTITASVKRDGQTSGKVVLNASGTFYKERIRNYESTKPIVKYKYWALGDYFLTEDTTFELDKKYYTKSGNYYYLYAQYSYTPDTTYQSNTTYYRYDYENNVYIPLVAGTDYTIGEEIEGSIYNQNYAIGDSIPSNTYYEEGSNTYIDINPSDITVGENDNTFTISNLNIGNNYDYQKAYRIVVQVSDNFVLGNVSISFTSVESNELSIAVGGAIFTEFKDRVDFKNITIRNTINVYDELFYSPGDTYEADYLYVGGFLSNSTKGIYFTIFLPKKFGNDINTATINNFEFYIRKSNGGYLENGATPSSFNTINFRDFSDNRLTIICTKSSAYSNVTNNTPISIEIRNLKVTFS